MKLNLSPTMLGQVTQVAEDIFVIKTLVGIGGGEGHLTHEGLRQRFLFNLKDGKENQILQEDSLSTTEMINEEADYIDAVRDGAISSFDIDTTTTIIRLTDGSLILHSPAEATGALVMEIAKLGSTVSAIIAPNLQHWLGCASWAELFPDAQVLVAPDAEGESLLEKLDMVDDDRASVLNTSGSLFDGQLEYRLLEGAPLMLNEVVFFHGSSSTLLVADGFYTGHCCNSNTMDTPLKTEPPNPFTRIWFKMTKDHWSSSQLPSYRTSRVLTNGEPEILVACIRSLVSDWRPQRMISAHGDTVTDSSPGQALISAWTHGVLR